MNSKEGGARGATVGGVCVLGAAGGNVTPVLCDWQYIHLNKGVSDIAFLLVESIRFDPFLVDLAVHFYYQLWAQKKGSRLGGNRTSSGGDGGVGGAGSTPRTAAGGLGYEEEPVARPLVLQSFPGHQARHPASGDKTLGRGCEAAAIVVEESKSGHMIVP
eukprot:g14087.t1